MLRHAIILGGGVGNRMEMQIPKQFIPILGKPILMHTIENFKKFDSKIEIIVVLPEAHILLWKNLCNEFKFDIEHQIVRGGKERFFSVQNAVEHIPNDSIVLIHDGVRPLVSHETIDRVLQAAYEKGTAIPYIDLNESIREITSTGSQALDRSKFKIIQTPQGFKSELIKKAYQIEYNPNFTDDASVIEAQGIEINMVLGNQRNIKITRPLDLSIAESLMTQS